jgi:hypothetical protein
MLLVRSGSLHARGVNLDFSRNLKAWTGSSPREFRTRYVPTRTVN